MCVRIPGVSTVTYRSLSFKRSQCGISCILWTFLCLLIQIQLLSVRAYVTMRQKEKERGEEGAGEKLFYFSSL